MITLSEVWRVARKALRWWWVIALSASVTTGTAFYLSRNETRYYTAHASLMVSDTIRSAAPDQNQLLLGGVLARFYGELARREPILRPVQEALGLPFPWQLINESMLLVSVVPNANLLEIYITDSQPARAAAIANAIGEHLVAYSPTSPDKIQAERAAVEQQLQDTDARIKQLKTKIADLTERMKQLSSASDLAEANSTLLELGQRLAQEESSYNALLAYKNNSVLNSLSFFERAAPPTQPLPTLRRVTLAMSALGGLLLGLVAAFLLEYLDPRFRGAQDIEDHFRIGSLGFVPSGPPLLIAPPAFVEERFLAAREVQSNILLAAPERGVRTLMLTSPQPSEARTGFSIDLADLFARSGQKVLLVDAEFTSSLLTRMLAAPDRPYGWTIKRDDQPIDIWAHLRPTPIPNVALLAGRSDADGGPVLLPSSRWREIVKLLHDIADVIIFDGPATLVGPDAALLAPHVEGVVLMLDPAADSREAISLSKARLSQKGGSTLLGAVLLLPSRHQFSMRKALKAPDGAEPAAAPPQPALRVRVFGREIRFVWGQPARAARPAAAPVPTAVAGGWPEQAAAPEPAPAAHGPIITPAPADDAPPADLAVAVGDPPAAAAPPPRRKRARRAASAPEPPQEA